MLLAIFYSNSYNKYMCWKCKNPIDASEKIYRNSTCVFCGADLHSCRNCKFYDIGSHYDCRENISDLVKEKESGNFCEWFSARTDFSTLTSADESFAKSEKAREQFNALFGDIGAAAGKAATSPKDAFKSLFGE